MQRSANAPCVINRFPFKLPRRREALYLVAFALAVLRSAVRSRLAPPHSSKLLMPSRDLADRRRVVDYGMFGNIEFKSGSDEYCCRLYEHG